MRRGLWFWTIAGLCMAGACHASEPVCFRTPADAAEQTGPRGVSGFRMESSSRDVYSGIQWAVVKSCEHPEWPGLMVFGNTTRTLSASSQKEAPAVRPFLLHAGEHVQVVMDDGLARLQIPGIALAGAAAGDQVRVRLVPVNAEHSSEQFATGIVRGGVTVEVVAR